MRDPHTLICCARHAWATVLYILRRADVTFTTTTTQGDGLTSGHVDLILPTVACGLVDHLARRLGPAPDPQPLRRRPIDHAPGIPKPIAERIPGPATELERRLDAEPEARDRLRAAFLRQLRSSS